MTRLELADKVFAEGTTASEFVERADVERMARFVAEVEFRAKNRRRLSLIDRKFDAGLSVEEAAELDGLQTYVGEWMAKHHPRECEPIEVMEARMSQIRQRLEERRRTKACR